MSSPVETTPIRSVVLRTPVHELLLSRVPVGVEVRDTKAKSCVVVSPLDLYAALSELYPEGFPSVPFDPDEEPDA